MATGPGAAMVAARAHAFGHTGVALASGPAVSAIVAATGHAGPLTGGSVTPARSPGLRVAGGLWTAHWLYRVAPTLGMVAGMHLYDALRPASVPAVPGGPVE